MTPVKTPKGDFRKDMSVFTRATFSPTFKVETILEIDETANPLFSQSKYNLDGVRVKDKDSATETQQASHPWFHHWLKSGATYQQQLPAFAAARENLEAQWKKTQRTTAVNEAADPERFDAINAVYTAASEGLKKLKTSAATESEHVVAHLDGLPEGLEGPTDDEKKATEIFNILSKFYWDMDRTEPSVEQTQKADAARTTFKERPPQIKGVRVESLASLLEILFPEDEEFETSPSQISSSPSEIEAYRLDQVSKQILQMFASLGPGE